MIRILHVTNIISPYRQHLFNAWAADCHKKNMELSTFFMAKGEPTRHWTPEDHPLNHPHKFHRGLHIPLPKFSRPIHMNPGIWRDMMFNTWDIVVVGGYDNITSAVAALLPKKGQLRLLWSESNIVSQRHGGFVSSRVKHLFINRYDGYIVPGQWAKEYICTHSSEAKAKPFLEVPNVIDEDKFSKSRFWPQKKTDSCREKWAVPKNHKVLLFVGRLDPKKGFDRVISATADKIDNPITYIIAGEGTMQDRIKRCANESKKINIKLVGYQREEQVRELMAISDAFILSSLFDPWPLVLVEAVTAGLPILCSNRVGNCRDVVREGWNGWIFDVMNPASILETVEAFSSTSTEKLTRMGRNSAQLADEKFKTRKVIHKLNENLLELYRNKRQNLKHT